MLEKLFKKKKLELKDIYNSPLLQQLSPEDLIEIECDSYLWLNVNIKTLKDKLSYKINILNIIEETIKHMKRIPEAKAKIEKEMECVENRSVGQLSLREIAQYEENKNKLKTLNKFMEENKDIYKSHLYTTVEKEILEAIIAYKEKDKKKK